MNFKAFFLKFNTHNIAALGATLIAIAGAIQLPQVTVFTGNLPPTTQHTIGIVQAGLVAVGTVLAYLGRPATVPSGGGN